MKSKKRTQSFFEENNYIVIKKVISPELASFIYIYFQNKRKVFTHMMENKFLSPYDTTWGTFNDGQIPNTYSHYADMAMETLLARTLPIVSKETGLDLIPCYSYARIYKYGDILHRHKDRPSCEISGTMNLGGDDWPIALDPTGEVGNKGVSIKLDPGDMLIYRGEKVEPWREAFNGYDCGQVFMHYNDKNGPFGEKNLYDLRPILGLPSLFKRKE